MSSNIPVQSHTYFYAQTKAENAFNKSKRWRLWTCDIHHKTTVTVDSTVTNTKQLATGWHSITALMQTCKATIDSMVQQPNLNHFYLTL